MANFTVRVDEYSDLLYSQQLELNEPVLWVPSEVRALGSSSISALCVQLDAAHIHHLSMTTTPQQGLPDLLNNNTGHPVKLEFQINNKFFFSMCYTTFGIYLY